MNAPLNLAALTSAPLTSAAPPSRAMLSALKVTAWTARKLDATMPRFDAPYFRPSEIAAAAELCPFIDSACQDAAGPQERRDAAAEAVDAIARRGAAPWPVLRILRRLYGLPFQFDPIGA